MTKVNKTIKSIQAIAGRIAFIAQNAKPEEWEELFDLCETFEALEDALKENVEDLRFLEQEIDREENYD